MEARLVGMDGWMDVTKAKGTDCCTSQLPSPLLAQVFGAPAGQRERSGLLGTLSRALCFLSPTPAHHHGGHG